MEFGMGSALPNINSAVAGDISAVSGISDQVADAIVEYIADNSPIYDFATLAEVQGVGPATIRKLRDWFSVSESSPEEFSEVDAEPVGGPDIDEEPMPEPARSRTIFEEFFIGQSHLAAFAAREFLNVRSPIQALALQQELAQQYFELAARMMQGGPSSYWRLR